MRAEKLLSIAAGVLIVWGCAGSRSEPVTVRSDGIEISAAVEPPLLRVGENVMWLELRTDGGAAITGADVDVKVHMHAMGAMAAMGGPAAVTELEDGRYRADFELAMGTTWIVEIAARRPGRAVARAEGSLTVGTAGVRLTGIGTPATVKEERHPSEFRIAPGRLQRIGVRVARAETKSLATTVRAVGRVVAEETTLEDVSLKVHGWVGEVLVDAVGDPVNRGDILFTVYSPELYAAQEEYLQALRSQQRARETSAPDRADYLVRAGRNRLRLWDIAEPDLERLARTGEPLENIPIRAPVTGYVVEKNLVRGSATKPGQRLYRIAPLSRVWVEAEVYEYELAFVREGQAATVTLPYLPGRSFEATVAYVYPTLDPETRTARLRLVLPNTDLALRPDMYANVRVQAARGERLVVPQSAVLYAGERSFVFRALGEGRFRPQPVGIGLRSGEEVEILTGLEPGDEIVSSGTFLIASESRLRAAMERW
ncbi:MAG: efflux RND transporter periplasmic adaptor subunit [Deltaproteobacteria bacterium]|nr:efflux RND transporter periplasmic adaptor subunit [Deltaproteobacteria bacterium]